MPAPRFTTSRKLWSGAKKPGGGFQASAALISAGSPSAG
jgi:hypothetical protein